MEKFKFLLLPLLVYLVYTQAAPTKGRFFTLADANHGDEIPGCYIVSFKNNSRQFAQDLIAMERAKIKDLARLVGNITVEFDKAIKGFTICGVHSEHDLNRIQNHSFVDYVEPDRVVKVNKLVTMKSPASWGLDRIDQRGNSLDAKFTYDDRKGRVNVYVIDTGIRISHEQFQGRAVYGYNALTGLFDSEDCNGHGTHCAGTVGGKDYGVCKHCRLVAVRVMECSGSGSWTSIINGINWVIANSTGTPAVISMSLGGGFTRSVNQAIASAYKKGITVVVAAGNANDNACTYSPASSGSAITVGAVGLEGERTYYSNYGPCVDLFAPGNDITSSWWTSDVDVTSLSGTSMATPHVAGVAAVYRSYNPSQTVDKVRKYLVETISTLNAISQLNNWMPNTPNRLLYSRIDINSQSGRDRTGAGDFEKLMTLKFSITLSKDKPSYTGKSFTVKSGKKIQGFVQATSVEAYDCDLILERKALSGPSAQLWENAVGGYSSSSTEFVEYIVPNGTRYSFRWTINTYDAIKKGVNVLLVFKTNFNG